MMKKAFVLLVKYIPVIQMAGMLVNNTLYKFDMLPRIGYLLDFVLGNSLLYFALIYICSITFGFCRWHRIIIAANLINLCFANINIHFAVPITDMELLCSYYVIAGIFIIIAARSHVKDIQNDKRKDKNT